MGIAVEAQVHGPAAIIDDTLGGLYMRPYVHVSVVFSACKRRKATLSGWIAIVNTEKRLDS
jgi:hypothetical protein